jgi:hypothetical protein
MLLPGLRLHREPRPADPLAPPKRVMNLMDLLSKVPATQPS